MVSIVKIQLNGVYTPLPSENSIVAINTWCLVGGLFLSLKMNS